MEILGIIGLYILIIIFAVAGLNTEGILKVVFWALLVAIVVWIAIAKPCNYSEHKTLCVICDIISFLIIFPALKR